MVLPDRTARPASSSTSSRISTCGASATQDPARFAGLPPGVQRHADARADREWKVAGLCGVHSGRPEVCRGFPYQRLPAPDGAAAGSEVHQLFPLRQLRARHPDHAARDPRGRVARRALARRRRLPSDLPLPARARRREPARSGLDRHLLPDEARRTELWAALYLPDTHPRLASRVPGLTDQWRAPLDIEGDRALYRALLDDTLEHVEALVERSGRGPGEFGMPGDAIARPDLAALLDPTRELLPPPAEAAARQVT